MPWSNKKTAGVAGLAVVCATIAILHAKFQPGGNDPVAKVVLHKSLLQQCFGTQVDDKKLRRQMIGAWEMDSVKNSSTRSSYIHLPKHNGRRKSWTDTTWEIDTYDSDSNLLYSATGQYELHGDLYIEHIDSATGIMTNYIGARPRFRVHVDGDKYYQLGVGNSIHEIWHRVEK